MVSAAFGILGLETSIGLGLTHLVHPGHLSLSDYITKSSVNRRKLLKLSEIRIAEGEVANLTIIDLQKEWTFSKEDIHSKSSNTPFVGHKMHGAAICAINNGKAWWRSLIL